MAIFFMRTSSVSRGAGRTATAAAAYRAGERLRDERTGEVFNFSGRTDVLHREIFLPGHFANGEAAWARERANLWNSAEQAESRANARVAREFLVVLPYELNAVQRVDLTRALSREIADRYGVAVDAAVHEPRPQGDPRNFHAHLLATTREARVDGLGAKTGLDLNGGQRFERGLSTGRAELFAVRERTGTLINDALRAAGLEVRVDHRTLVEQGIHREPKIRIPWGAYRAEQRGQYSDIAERVREAYRARSEARAQAAAPRQTQTGAAQMEALRREARESWLQLRQAERSEPAPVKQASASAGKGRDQDLGL